MKIFSYLLVLSLTFAVKFSFSQTLPSYVPSNGLEGWWPFSGNANDYSGNSHHGTVSGAALTTDRFGQLTSAYYFDGNSWISHANNTNLDIIDDLTISCWIVPKIGNPGGQIVWFGDNAGAMDPYSIVVASNHQVYFRRDGGGGTVSDVVSASPNLIPDSTYHVVGVVAPSLNLMKIYINGVLNNTATVTAPVISYPTSSLYLNFGALENGLAMRVKATIDDIGIWRRALTDCEIQGLYRSTSFKVFSNKSLVCSGQAVNLSASGAASYSWSNGASTASVTVSPSVATIYTVTATYPSSCTETKTISVNVSTCKGITENEEVHYAVYPNPANDILIITNPATISTKFLISNVLGQIVKSGSFAEGVLKMDVSEWSEGLYFIRLEGNEKAFCISVRH